MDYRYLKAFLLTAKHKSFSKAAEELNIAQSAVSRQVSLLEESLKQQLLLRSSRKVELTSAGHHLVVEAQKFEDWVENQFHEKKLTVRIGALTGVIENWLIQKLVSYPNSAAAEGTNYTIQSGTNDSITKDLIEGQIDLGFVNEKIETGILSTRKLFSEDFCLVSKRPVQLKSLSDETWIYGQRGGYLRRLSKNGGQKFIRVESPTAILKLVEAGMGVAVVAKHLIPAYSKLEIQDLPQLSKGTIYPCLPNVKKISPHIQKFVRHLSAEV